MSNILHITASIREQGSLSRSLSDTLVASLAKKSGAAVVTRDLADNDLPFIDADRFAANLAPHADRTPQQQELAAISDTLIAELQDADTIVLGLPFYNFSVPATVKAWADLVARAGTTFTYTPDGPKGLLKGKKTYITIATGGTPVGSDIDFMTPWLKFFLAFIGIEDVEMIAVDGIIGQPQDDKIAAATARIEKLAA